MRKAIVGLVLTGVAVLSACSKAPSQSQVCEALAKGAASEGIIDSVSQAQVPEGKCKVLIVGDTGEVEKTVRTVEWDYTVYKDGKYTSSVTKDESSPGDKLPPLETKEEVLAAADRYAKANLLTKGCTDQIASFFAMELGMSSEEMRACKIPVRLIAALAAWEDKYPAPTADPKDACIGLAEATAPDIEYTEEENGGPYDFAVLNGSKPGFCEVVFKQSLKVDSPLMNGLGKLNVPYDVVVSFHYKSLYGGYSKIESDPAVKFNVWGARSRVLR